MTPDVRIPALALLSVAGCDRSSPAVRPPARDGETLLPVAAPHILRAITTRDARRDAVFAYVRDDGRTEIAEATTDGIVRPLLVVDGSVSSLASRADDELVFVVDGRGYLEAPETSDRLLGFDGSATSDLGDRLLDALPTERDLLLRIGAVDIDDAGRVVTMVSPRRDEGSDSPGSFLCVLSPMGDTCEPGPADGAWQLVADGSFTYVRIAHRVLRRADGADAWEELEIPDAADLVALTDGGVAVREQRIADLGRSGGGTLHVLAPDGTEARRIADFGVLVGHRVEGGWELFEDFEAVARTGGWSHHSDHERVWTQLIVRRLDGESIEVGRHDARVPYLGSRGIVLPDGSLRIETTDGVFVIAPPPSP